MSSPMVEMMKTLVRVAPVEACEMMIEACMVVAQDAVAENKKEVSLDTMLEFGEACEKKINGRQNNEVPKSSILRDPDILAALAEMGDKEAEICAFGMMIDTLQVMFRMAYPDPEKQREKMGRFSVINGPAHLSLITEAFELINEIREETGICHEE